MSDPNHPNDPRPNALVLCTGNSCRSQMAEGYLRHYASDRLNAFSAGTDPKDEVHPLAVRVMREDGIDISEHRPKHIKLFLGRNAMRYVIIVCSDAEQTCPRIWPGMMSRLFWPFDDPAAFQRSESETLAEFRRVRDEIKEKILAWIETLPKS
jgi:arsenate reductase